MTCWRYCVGQNLPRYMKVTRAEKLCINHVPELREEIRSRRNKKSAHLQYPFDYTYITFPDWISNVLISFYLATVQYNIGFEAEGPITALNISFS